MLVVPASPPLWRGDRGEACERGFVERGAARRGRCRETGDAVAEVVARADDAAGSVVAVAVPVDRGGGVCAAH